MSDAVTLTLMVLAVPLIGAGVLWVIVMVLPMLLTLARVPDPERSWRAPW